MESKVVKRSKNFTEVEKQLLIDICSNFKDVIENKKTDGTSVKEKNRAWEEIRSIFNASAETGERTVKQLHALYDNMKKTVRKDNHDDRVEKYKTGGGVYTAKVTETGAKLLALLAPQFQPLKSPYDSSATYYGNETNTSSEIPWPTQLPEGQVREILVEPLPSTSLSSPPFHEPLPSSSLSSPPPPPPAPFHEPLPSTSLSSPPPPPPFHEPLPSTSLSSPPPPPPFHEPLPSTSLSSPPPPPPFHEPLPSTSLSSPPPPPPPPFHEPLPSTSLSSPPPPPPFHEPLPSTSLSSPPPPPPPPFHEPLPSTSLSSPPPPPPFHEPLPSTSLSSPPPPPPFHEPLPSTSLSSPPPPPPFHEPLPSSSLSSPPPPPPAPFHEPLPSSPTPPLPDVSPGAETSYATPFNKGKKRKYSTNAAAHMLLHSIKQRKMSKNELDYDIHKKKMEILEEELKLKKEITQRTVKLLETEQQIKDIELKMKLIQYEKLIQQ